MIQTAAIYANICVHSLYFFLNMIPLEAMVM